MSGYDTDLHLGTGTNTPYLTYGYDEYGNDLHDLYKDLEDTGIPNPYSRQGEDQPFGYTGYRHDEISGTYFAQAREYQPQNGRFTAQDVIQGNGAYPETLNRYGYCLGNPVGLVDRDGRRPTKKSTYAVMPEVVDPYKDTYITTPQPYPNAFITTVDPDAEYYSIDKETKILTISVQYGTGFYGKVDLEFLKISIGAKIYQQISSHNWRFYKNGMEASAGLSFLVGLEAGIQRVVCPMLGNQVQESGLFYDMNLLGIEKEKGDYIWNFGVGLFLGIGAEVDLEINFSEAHRRLQKKFKNEGKDHNCELE